MDVALEGSVPDSVRPRPAFANTVLAGGVQSRVTDKFRSPKL
jgi:hypothetical protein